MRMTRRTGAAAAAVALTLLVSGCGTEDPSEAVSPIGSDGTVDAAEPGADETDDGELAAGEVRPVAGVTERTVSHLQADITVRSAEVSYEVPWTKVLDNREPEYGDSPLLYVEVKVSNRLLNTGLLLQDGIFLDIGTGELLPNVVVDSGATTNIAAGTSADGWYGFELPDPDIPAETAVLVLGNADQRQDLLPLVGDVPEPAYPKQIQVASPGTVLTGLRGRSRGQCPVEVEVTDAVLAHWIGFDQDGRSHATRQAAADALMLRLDLSVSVPAAQVSCFINTDSELRLVTDGDRRSDRPLLNETGLVKGGATESQYVVFEVPASGEVELEWGRLDSETVRITVPVP